MVYKNFIINITIRIILILLVICFFAWFLLVNIDYIKASFALLLVIILTAELVRYVNKSNRDFRDFINLLKSNDFSTRFSSKGKGHSFEILYKELNELSDKYHLLSIEKELKHRHLQTVLGHIDIGIISYDSSGTIQIVNHAFKELFQSPFLSEHQSIDKLDEKFVYVIKGLQTGSNKLFKVKIGERELHLALQANIYKLKEEEFKLISVKNIISELEQKELESYQKLIRVLTHEIMNSITPIASLSNTLNDLLKQNELQGNTELAEHVKTGIEAIHDRSSNLLEFTESYRKLTRLPQPEFKKISLDELIQNTHAIVKSFPGAEKINFKIEIEPNITFNADPKMIEQVFMNIYKNAIEVLDNKQSPEITTSSFLTANKRLQIEISDNGPGMKKEILEKIFIPFYTTKQDGSGIGLSLCRQIILAHHGYIKAESKEGHGTRISIIL
jgi:nitrogen fixation/metabolism regulation signal transduction histidine kinase